MLQLKVRPETILELCICFCSVEALTNPEEGSSVQAGDWTPKKNTTIKARFVYEIMEQKHSGLRNCPDFI